MVWEPRQHIGASVVNVHGALTWNELASPDPEASAAFYSALFGWKAEAMPGATPPYLVISNAEGHSNGGIRNAAASEPCYWLVYFGSDDLERTLATAGELGGSTLMEPVDIGPGRFAAVQDPQGAVFALYSGEFDT
jgi:predicted enzyme related to lactoylglutathione lyase